MKKINSNLDERQEMNLLKIEHNGCRMAFWGLLAAILFQEFLGINSMSSIAGELIVFMCLAIYLMVSCMKNGIWDRKLKPTLKTNAIVSGAAGTVMGIIWFVIFYRNYHNFIGSIMTGIFMFLSTGILCLIMLSLSAALYKKRIRKLKETEDDSENND